MMMVLRSEMRKTERGLDWEVGEGNQEFNSGHVKFEIPVRHKSRDVRTEFWNIRVWELTEMVWVEYRFGIVYIQVVFKARGLRRHAWVALTSA